MKGEQTTTQFQSFFFFQSKRTKNNEKRTTEDMEMWNYWKSRLLLPVDERIALLEKPHENGTEVY